MYTEGRCLIKSGLFVFIAIAMFQSIKNADIIDLLLYLFAMKKPVMLTSEHRFKEEHGDWQDKFLQMTEAADVLIMYPCNAWP